MAIFNGFTNHYVQKGELKKATEQLDIANKTIESNSENVGKLANALVGEKEAIQDVSKAVNAGTEATKATKDSIDNGFDRLLKNEKLQAAGQTFVIAASTVTLIKGACEIYQYMRPTEEQQVIKKAETELAIRQLRILETEEAMNKCLMDHSKSAKDEEGMPIVCKGECDLFGRAAGMEALRRVKNVLKPLHD
jgi:hypothetical protein